MLLRDSHSHFIPLYEKETFERESSQWRLLDYFFIYYLSFEYQASKSQLFILRSVIQNYHLFSGTISQIFGWGFSELI